MIMRKISVLNRFLTLLVWMGILILNTDVSAVDSEFTVRLNMDSQKVSRDTPTPVPTAHGMFCGDGICQTFLGELTPPVCEDCQTTATPQITGAEIVEPPRLPFDCSFGDLWFVSYDWGNDSNPWFNMTWGDGCGIDTALKQIWSDAGVVSFQGPLPVPGATPHPDPFDTFTFVSMEEDVPDGIAGQPFDGCDDKPSSILAITHPSTPPADPTYEFYLAGHSPQGPPAKGYIARWPYEEGPSAQFTELPDTPWIDDSKFKILMFINREDDYPDDHLYALGIGTEYDWNLYGDSEVFLTRFDRNIPLMDYSQFEYFTGLSSGLPVWSTEQDDAQPVPGLFTASIGSAIYKNWPETGDGSYLFLTTEGLFEAPEPWGPWFMVAPLIMWGDNPDWRGGYMPGLIAFPTGTNDVYFTLSGQDDIIGYKFHLGKIEIHRTPTPGVTRDYSPQSLRKKLHSQDTEDLPECPMPRDYPKTATGDSSRNILHVPSLYGTIQAGIDAAVTGDTVLLANQVYTTVGNYDLDFGGKAITVQSENGPETCIIDCQNQGRGFYFHTGEQNNSIVRGITIRNGFTRSAGGGIYCLDAAPTFDFCRIINCTSFYYGGAITSYSSTGAVFTRMQLTNSILAGNYSGLNGGAMLMYNTSADILNCVITGNFSETAGGAYFFNGDIEMTMTLISENGYMGEGGDRRRAVRGGGCIFEGIRYGRVDNCIFENNEALTGGALQYHLWLRNPPAPELLIMNCTFTGNLAETGQGSAIMQKRYSHLGANLTNCIIRDNNPGNEIYIQPTPTVGCTHCQSPTPNPACVTSTPTPSLSEFILGTPVVQYSNIQGDFPGVGNIDADPLFIPGPLGDYYLSQTASGQAQDSPCLDSGSETAGNICFNLPAGVVCMDELTTRTDQVFDSGQVDIGFHYAFVPCVRHGDVNDSGDVTAGDAQMAFNIALAFIVPTYEEECAADCNNDGGVTAGDAQAIFNTALGTGTCADPL